jgi:hypothetical protein
VPASLLGCERYVAAMITAAPVLLERVRAAYDGPLMLMKGPEVAVRYAHPSDRPFRDLDLLAEDARSAQRALVRAGFVQVGGRRDYEKTQHLCPLIWPGLPLVIEVHHHPNHPPWLSRRSAEEVLARGVPSATGVEGLLAPNPAAHTLLLVAHSWAHQPLGRLADLVDAAAVLAGGDPRQVEAIACNWGWDGMWRVSQKVTSATLGDGETPRASRLWARHLASGRDRTVLENHLARMAAPVWALPPRRVPAALVGVVRSVLTPGHDERWAQKLHRSRLAVAHALSAKSTHERTLAG